MKNWRAGPEDIVSLRSYTKPECYCCHQFTTQLAKELGQSWVTAKQRAFK